MTCPRDGAAMWEDRGFTLDAEREGVAVRRWVGLCGHSVYEGPEPERRGWVAREARRVCRRCDAPIRVGRGDHRGARLCLACRRGAERCVVCGKPTERNRATCGAACLRQRSSEIGRASLAKLRQQQRKMA